MSWSTFLRRFAAGFGGEPPAVPSEAVDAARVRAGIEAVVETIEPRLRLVPDYQGRLAPGVTSSLSCIDAIVAGLPEADELSRQAWAADPLINAFFAADEDVTAMLGRSRGLREFFAAPANLGCSHAYALLGATKSEHAVIAPGMVDGVLRQDVAQVTVCFADQRLRAPAADLAGCRVVAASFILGRLAAFVRDRIGAEERHATELEEHEAVLAARLRSLRAHLGRPHASGVHEHDGEIAKLEQELANATDAHAKAGSAVATLDARLERICAILAAPRQHLQHSVGTLRVSRLGMKMSDDSSEPCSSLTLHELCIGGGIKRTVLFVRCAKSEIPPPRDLLAEGARHLL